MPKMRCKCDYIFDLSKIPCKDGHLLVAEEEADSIFNRKDSVDDIYDELISTGTSMLLCPRCNRLWLEDVADNRYIEYQQIRHEND